MQSAPSRPHRGQRAVSHAAVKSVGREERESQAVAAAPAAAVKRRQPRRRDREQRPAGPFIDLGMSRVIGHTDQWGLAEGPGYSYRK